MVRLALIVSCFVLGYAQPGHGQEHDSRHASDRVFQPGVRFTYYIANANLPGESRTWTPHPNGQWVNSQGQRFNLDDNPVTAGYGYNQHTVVGVDHEHYAIETRTYTVADVERNIYTLTQTTGRLDRRGEEIPGFWVDPRQLAATDNRNESGMLVVRLPYKLGNQTFNAIRFQYQKDAGGNWAQRTYDLDTGLLLAESSATVGKPPLVSGSGGNLQPGQGTTTITSVIFRGARQLRLPFADQRLPGWVERVRTMEFAGTVKHEWFLAQAMPQTTPILSTFELQPVGQLLKARQTARQGLDPDPILNTAVFDRVYGPIGIGQLWLPPAQLQQGQVLDEDPYTSVRCFVEQVAARIIITEASPWQSWRHVYDAESRMLVAAQQILEQGAGRMTVDVALKQAR